MKIIFRNISLAAIIALISIALFDSCRKAPINGKLDGQWQIMSINSVDDDTQLLPENTFRYVCINLHVIQFTGNGGGISGNMHYDKSEKIIFCDFPYNTEGAAFKHLENYGIYENPAKLEILTLTSSKLVYKTSGAIVTCRKY